GTKRARSGRPRLPRLACVAAICVLAFGASAQEATTPPVGITERQLIENWKAVDQLDRRQQSYTIRLSLPTNPKWQYRQSRVKVRPDRWVSSTEHQGTRAVFAKSPQYVFILWKDPTAPDWSLKAFEGAGAATASSDLERSSTYLRDSRPLGTLATLTKKFETRDPTVYEYSQRPEFKITRISQPAPDRDRVEFTCGDASGWLLTDRLNRSIVIQSEMKIGKVTPTTYPCVVEMKQRELQGTGDAVRCRKFEWSVRHGVTGELFTHEVYDFTDYSDDPIPDQDFMLSGFGLPEAVGVEPKKRIANYIWFLIGAAVLGVIAIGLRLLARRRVPNGVQP
ncbi:MAG TPA: hypothetical protein VGE74_00935, partial [Gemmata sp.]